MNTNSQTFTEDFDKILIGNLQRTIDFLKFAEAKNAVLLTVASGWVMALTNLLFSEKIIQVENRLLLIGALILAVTAGMLAIFSFLPKVNLASFLGGDRAGPHPKNLLFYGDVCSIPLKTFEQKIFDYQPANNHLTKKYIHDLIVQIHVNSEITMCKMRMFKRGIILMSLCTVILLIQFIALGCESSATLW